MDRSLCGQKVYGGCPGESCDRQCSATIYVPADETEAGRHILKSSRLTLLLAIGVLIPFLAVAAVAGAQTWPNTRIEHAPT
jgi:hypothetical protein